MTDAPDTDYSDRWWLPIAALAATFPVIAVLSLLLPPDPVTMLPALAVAVLGFGLALCSPVFVYYDTQFLAAADDWVPSVLYYLMVVPLVGPLVAGAYLYRRHREVGTPANPFADRA